MDKAALERELADAKDDLENNLSKQEELRSMERALRAHIRQVEELLEYAEEE